MKRVLSLLLLFSFMTYSSAFAEVIEDKILDNLNESQIKPPVWEEYVAPKYKNPRKDFTRGSAIAEIAVGDILTALLVTAPIGIPLAVHGVTKIKMISYANRKEIFEDLVQKANLIEDDTKREAAYKHALKRAHLKEKTRAHYMKKAAKAEAKAAKKAAKEAKN